ncbi:MAG TPA: aspartate kinase [Chitinophagaceae bacterium]|nr:aspartate kinase [Chitinophagaceae bacterium]
MKIFKFGGSALADMSGVQHLGEIMSSFSSENILVIFSAAGKTTSALEKVAEVFYSGKKDQALALFEDIKTFHTTLARQLLANSYNEALAHLSSFFTEVEWMLHDKPVRGFDYYYDQVVCTGELLSSYIVSSYFNEIGIANQWLDVRDIIRTDNSFTSAVIDWDFTSRMAHSVVQDSRSQYNIIVTQGFIGSTDENESTTLGPGGKDYSAAVFASILNATSLTLWKDVDGLLDADPGRFEGAASFAELNYNDAAGMAVYGSRVIDPKTIGTLQEKNIPLFVRSFLDTSKPGTLVSQNVTRGQAIRILKEGQVVVYLKSASAFMYEELAEQFFKLLRENRLIPKLVQIGAVNITCCLDDQPAQIERFALAASGFSEVQIEKGVTLLTILHGSEPLLQEMIHGKTVILTQQFETTMHAVWRE